MAIVRFDQDSTQPFGTGIFTNDQGRQIYTFDPDSARTLGPTPPPGTPPAAASDWRTAEATGNEPPSPYANAVAANPGATGSAALGVQPNAANPTPASAVAKLDTIGHGTPATTAAPTPKSTVAKLDALPVVGSQHTTTTVQGRDKGTVAATETKLHAADTGSDVATKTAAENADARTQQSLSAQQGGDLSASARQFTDYEQARQEKEAAQAEVKRLRGESDVAVDPGRFLDNMSTGKSIGMVLLSALSGAFGNMQGQGQNPFMTMLNKRIDQDIEVQKDQIAQGRLRRGNAIADAMSRGATAQQAEDIARSKFYEAGENYLKLQAQRLGVQGVNADAANQAIAAVQSQRIARDDALLASTEARRQSTDTTERSNKPPAGANMLELQNKALENYGKAVDAGTDPKSAYTQSGMAALGLAMPTGPSKEERAAAKPTDAELKVEATREPLQAFGEGSGLQRDPKTGKWRGGEGSAREALGYGSKVDKTAYTGAVASVAQALGGGKENVSLAEDLLGGDSFFSSMTTAERAAHMNAAESVLRSRRPVNSRNETDAIPFKRIQ